MTTSFEQALPEGARIEGKWKKNVYRVERLLGEGANGKVYLVRKGRQSYALKMALDAVALQSEINALKALSQTDTSFRRFWIEADDWKNGEAEYPFFIMRYMEGKSLTDYIREHGSDWIPVIGLNLLRKLRELHAGGFVFGDLKPENMIITRYGDVELIDFGGLTAKGRAVKQFTEVFDRGFWSGGSRQADDAYDLFSFAALLVSVADRERRFHQAHTLLPQNRSIDVLLDIIRQTRSLSPVASVLRGALQGRYGSSKQALADWRAKSLHTRPPRAKAVQGDWVKVCFALSLLLFGAAIYFVWK